MLVSELKKHMQSIRASNLFALANRFNADPDILRDMLNLLIRKGIVRKCLQTANCGTKCNRCNPLMTEIYEWVGAETCHPCPRNIEAKKDESNAYISSPLIFSKKSLL